MRFYQCGEGGDFFAVDDADEWTSCEMCRPTTREAYIEGARKAFLFSISEAEHEFTRRLKRAEA